jgi:hypothetical protein
LVSERLGVALRPFAMPENLPLQTNSRRLRLRLGINHSMKLNRANDDARKNTVIVLPSSGALNIRFREQRLTVRHRIELHEMQCPVLDRLHRPDRYAPTMAKLMCNRRRGSRNVMFCLETAKPKEAYVQ